MQFLHFRSERQKPWIFEFQDFPFAHDSNTPYCTDRKEQRKCSQTTIFQSFQQPWKSHNSVFCSNAGDRQAGKTTKASTDWKGTDHTKRGTHTQNKGELCL